MKLRVPNLPSTHPRALAAGGAALLIMSLAAYSPVVPEAGERELPAAAAVTRLRDVVQPASAAAAKAEAAMAVLGPRVSRTSDGGALRAAVQAYFNYREARPGEVSKPYLYFVDLGLDNATPRGWVFDMDGLTVVEGPFTVAHGRGSGPRDGVPNKFSNAPGSYASSLGLYLAQETYTFTGKSAGRRYASVGLRLRGESGQFNGAARSRGIVAHGAPYVSRREAGRSEGCPAMETARANRLLPLIASGGVVFIYSPKDARWLAGDPWLQPAFTPTLPNLAEQLSH